MTKAHTHSDLDPHPHPSSLFPVRAIRLRVLGFYPTRHQRAAFRRRHDFAACPLVPTPGNILCLASCIPPPLQFAVLCTPPPQSAPVHTTPASIRVSSWPGILLLIATRRHGDSLLLPEGPSSLPLRLAHSALPVTSANDLYRARNLPTAEFHLSLFHSNPRRRLHPSPTAATDSSVPPSPPCPPPPTTASIRAPPFAVRDWPARNGVSSYRRSEARLHRQTGPQTTRALGRAINLAGNSPLPPTLSTHMRHAGTTTIPSPNALRHPPRRGATPTVAGAHH